MSMDNQMINLVIFLLDKKLWTSIFLTASPVHSAEFEEILVLTSSHFAQIYILRYRIDISEGNISSQFVLMLLAK